MLQRQLNLDRLRDLCDDCDCDSKRHCDLVSKSNDRSCIRQSRRFEFAAVTTIEIDVPLLFRCQPGNVSVNDHEKWPVKQTCRKEEKLNIKTIDMNSVRRVDCELIQGNLPIYF